MLSLCLATLVVGAYIVAVAVGVAATSFPATVDLNLVFPSATQHLTYGLYDANNWSAPSWGAQVVRPSTQFHLDTNGTTYITVVAMPQLLNKTGSWLLEWQFDTVNCSTTTPGDAGPEAFADTGLGYTSRNYGRWLTFSTTADGSGAEPDIAAAAANTTCGAQVATGSGPGIIDVASTYNLTGASLLIPDDEFYGDLCAVLVSSSSSSSLSSSLTPTPTTPLSCAVSLDAGAITSISAAATQEACTFFTQ